MTIFNISPKAEEVTNNVFMVDVPIGQTINLFELCKGIHAKDKYHIDPFVSVQTIGVKAQKDDLYVIFDISIENTPTNTFVLKGNGVYHILSLDFKGCVEYDAPVISYKNHSISITTDNVGMIDTEITGELNLITGDVFLAKASMLLPDSVKIVSCKFRVELTPK